MATNGANNVEDADMAECDGQKVVTMMDVLQEQQDFEDDANAVLGASDEKNCTYSKGYIKRQAIYACLTCCTEAKNDPTKRAGVCLACSLNCHENHELIELYTKRNFRCDCGNPKFNSHPCQFTPDKIDLNEDNKYNQNFSGLYCNCHRSYPDQESTVEDEEMIQCIICEDWLHASHLDAVVPGSDQYSEMICKACMENNEFLYDYSNLAVNVEATDEDIVAINGTDMNLSNGDLNTEILVNGADDTAEESITMSKIDMDVDETHIENESHTESENITENQELEKPVIKSETVESNDVTVEAEKTEEPSQISSDTNAESKDETGSAITSEENTKANEDASDDHPEPQETKKSLLENGEEVKDPLESENTKIDEKVEEDISETEKSEVSDKNAENIDSTEAKNEIAEITPENNKENDMLTLNSKDAKQEEDGENTVNNDTKTASLENDGEMKDSSKEITENVDLPKDDTNKTDITETDKPSNEITSEAEINDKTDITETDKISNEITSQAEINDETDIIETDKPSNEITSEAEMNDENDITETDKISSKTTSEAEIFNKTDSIETDKPFKEITSEAETNSSESKTESIETPKDDTDDLSANKIGVSSEAVNNTQENKENKRKFSTEEDTDDNLVKKPKLDGESRCTRPKSVKRVHRGATFWPPHFRQKLCTCNDCLSMYKDLSVLFLLDPEDTVFAYEALGKERVDGRATQYEKGLEALSSLDRIQQINALTEYNKMKDKLLDFLKSFKDRKEIVKEEDIKAFFAGMKPKREPDGVYFCR